jgi:protein-disulfide isomerase
LVGTPPPEDPAGKTITIRIRRVHLWALAGLAAGALVGFFVGRETAEDPRPVLYGLPAAPGATGTTAPASDAKPVDVDVRGRPAFGPEDAKVTMVEFVDFECPFCGRYARDTFPRLEREYGDRIRYVSRHFPLQIHANARGAAEAAECAHRQGRYWEYHRVLFQNQKALDRKALIAHARHAGLDVAKLRDCLAARDVLPVVQKDVDDGRRYGVTGTPAFFIDGRLVKGAVPYEQLKAELDRALDG